jgi:hypothetical protein
MIEVTENMEHKDMLTQTFSNSDLSDFENFFRSESRKAFSHPVINPANEMASLSGYVCHSERVDNAMNVADFLTCTETVPYVFDLLRCEWNALSVARVVILRLHFMGIFQSCSTCHFKTSPR